MATDDWHELPAADLRARQGITPPRPLASRQVDFLNPPILPNLLFSSLLRTQAGLRTQDSGLRTQASELTTQNSELKTQNSELRTQDSELRTQD